MRDSPLPHWVIEELPDTLSPTQLSEFLDGQMGHWLRRDVVSSLQRQKVRVHGDAGWAGIVADYRGPAEHGDTLTKIYRAARINVDVPRLYQREIITMRAFDVMAAGGLLVTEAEGDLERLSRGRGVVTYRGEDQLREEIKTLLERPAHAKEIARAGQQWVQSGHLIEHRLQQIVDGCRNRGWLPA